ncbi:MAG: GNAT family N-acetyltransferase [Leptolyngbya sp. SIOISBB]|nr:GNAT family N-acetyltransferase [Leptolyngbya sp. SIOISBB]
MYKNTTIRKLRKKERQRLIGLYQILFYVLLFLASFQVYFLLFLSWDYELLEGLSCSDVLELTTKSIFCGLLTAFLGFYIGRGRAFLGCYAIWIIQINGITVGRAILSKRDTDCWLTQLNVLYPCRNKGLGKKLMETLLQTEGQVIYVRALSNVEKFYTKLGFMPFTHSNLAFSHSFGSKFLVYYPQELLR